MNVESGLFSEEELGERIRRLRQRLGLPLRAVAKAVGVSAPAVSRWENGGAKPRKVFHSALADALDVSESELLFGVDADQFDSVLAPVGRRPRLHNAAQAPDLEAQRSPLSDLISTAKQQIADAAGTTPDRVTIQIEV